MRLHVLFVLTLCLQTPLFGQTGTPPPPETTPSPSRSVFLKRWLDLQNATLNLRYRYVDNSARVVTTNQLQHRETARGRLKLDESARYTVNFGAFTGTRFTSGWDNTPW